MAWEWVEPVASPLAGVLGAIVGIFGTLKATERQGEAQVKVAREERQQRRLEASYMELLTLLSELGAWAQIVFPSRSVPEEFVITRMPEPAPHREALLTAYWSPRIQALKMEFDDRLLELSNKGVATVVRAQSGTPSEKLDALFDLAEFRGELREIDERIREQVRRELLGQDDGSERP